MFPIAGGAGFLNFQAPHFRNLDVAKFCHRCHAKILDLSRLDRQVLGTPFYAVPKYGLCLLLWKKTREQKGVWLSSLSTSLSQTSRNWNSSMGADRDARVVLRVGAIVNKNQRSPSKPDDQKRCYERTDLPLYFHLYFKQRNVYEISTRSLPGVGRSAEEKKMERNVIPVDFRTIKAFVSLEFSGGIGMLILLSSALLSQTQLRIKRPYNAGSTLNEAAINRSRTWFSFCISWIISCFSYCLLFFAGKQLDTSKPPPFGLCLTQAALIYSAPPLTGATTSALFYDVWLMFRLASVRDHSLGRATRVLLLAAPYVMWMIITVALVITGGLTPEIVEHNLENDPFCVMKPNAIPLFIALLTLIFALAALGMLSQSFLI
ncbi:hypothetical protein D9757_000013 [Collybiopsis confluens]|uniref:Uncharacterized protein n=1 Tax=Collybiopsis confluens TaxID=2823264 RepID=A0A8H5I2G7_9AGAR|nr:hypothetical protein D9757_000013 [Collybiopsis confluens]